MMSMTQGGGRTSSGEARSRTPHRIIRASAGSGKTFALTNRYIDLLRHGVDPASILATTFTRKAAGEILGKVFSRLAEAAGSQSGREQLSRHLSGPAVTEAECHRLLAVLTGALHRLSITTIDAFFNRITQSFRYELDVPLDPQMVEDGHPLAVELRGRAIEAMLADDDLQTLIKWLRQYHHDARSVTGALDRIVGDFYGIYREAPDRGLWDRLPRDKPLDEAALHAAIAQLETLQAHLPLNKSGAPDGRWGKAWAGDLRQARLGQWEAFISSGLAGKIAAGEDQYFRSSFTDDWLAAYEPLVGHARAVVLGRVMDRHLAVFDLLARFDGHYRRLRRDHGILFFSELAQKLVGGLGALDAATLMEIYFRLDVQVRHLLLDEFQDTSLDQWAVLRPFAEEITAHGDPDLASGRTFFCVGDTKQAIYGWRGGCTELFNAIEGQLHLPADARQEQATSHRSSPVVLECVNEVFGRVSGCAVLENDEAAARRFEAGFVAHTAADGDKPGYVRLETSEAVPGEPGNGNERDATDEQDSAAEIGGHERYVAKRVAQLYEAAPGCEIGVLVSTNTMANLMIYELRYQGLTVSGEGGGPLTDSSAVSTVLSALVLADHPGDSASAFHVVNSPLGEVLGLRSTEESVVRTVSRQVREALVSRGYADVIGEWTKRLAGCCDGANLARLTQLVDLAEQYQPELSFRPTRFVRFVERIAVERAQSAPIRVMTINRAKGLEFDAVVLCELDRRLQDQPKFLLGRDGPMGPIEAVYPAGNEVARGMNETLAEAFDQHRDHQRYEDLCKLYVAMTRARHALHLIVKPRQLTNKGKLRKPACSFASILRSSLSEVDEDPGVGEVLYEHGDPNWTRCVEAAAEVRHPAAPLVMGPVALAAAPEAGPRRSWTPLIPSQLENQGRVTGDELLDLAGGRARARGTLFHGWFELVGFIDEPDALPTTEALLERGRLLLAEQPDAFFVPLIEQFRAVLQRADVRQALARRGAARLWRERPFAVRDGRQLLRGQFDRVAIRIEAEQVSSVELIDFKTDHLPKPTAASFDDELARRVDTYRPQVEAYCRALGRLLRVERDQILARLLFVAPGRLVDI